MTANDFLSQYKDAKESIILIEAERENIRRIAAKSKSRETVALLSQYDREHKEQIERMIAKMHDVKKVISMVRDSTQRNLLTRIYVLDQSHKEAAIDLRISERWEREIFSRAKRNISMPMDS